MAAPPPPRPMELRGNGPLPLQAEPPVKINIFSWRQILRMAYPPEPLDIKGGPKPGR